MSGQGDVGEAAANVEHVGRWSELCDEEVSRRGECAPCEKIAVAVRIDPEGGHWYAVCARHARADMVPLATLLAAFAREWDTRPRPTPPSEGRA